MSSEEIWFQSLFGKNDAEDELKEEFIKNGEQDEENFEEEDLEEDDYNYEDDKE